jgi:hypothetical protein
MQRATLAINLRGTVQDVMHYNNELKIAQERLSIGNFLKFGGTSIAIPNDSDFQTRYMSIIDSKDTPQEQMCKLQALVWQLQSEN